MVKQWTMTPQWILTFGIVLLLVSSCTSSTRQSIIGRWEFEGIGDVLTNGKPLSKDSPERQQWELLRLGYDGQEFEFFKDGTVKYTASDMLSKEKTTLLAKYRFLDDKQMLIEFPPDLTRLSLGQTTIYGVRVAKGQLILSLSEEGTSVELVYVRP
jgi:hypothetical protein